ncbi:MAG: hypothetical protein IPG88_03265 [Gemmatimonadetes bacterium]|nr:hypothetical protein [Gemmatimonadota bacterium]
MKHMVEAHGGRVTADSTAGLGTTVSAYFPDLTAFPRGDTPASVATIPPLPPG